MRLYSSQGAQIQDQLVAGIKNTVISLAGALGEDIVIEGVQLPNGPMQLTHPGGIKYQCGDINPVITPEKATM